MRKHILNSAWAVSETLAYPVVSFLATPLLIQKLGTESFGLWVLFITIVAMGTVINAGTSAAIIKMAAQAIPEARGLAPVVSGALAIAAICGGLLFIGTSIFFAAFAESLFSRMGGYEIVLTTGVAGALVLCVDQFDVALQSLLKGAEKFSVAAKLELIFRPVQIGACAAIAALGQGLLAVYTTFTVIALMRLIFKLGVIKKTWPDLHFRPRWTLARNILTFSAWGWLQGLGGMLFNVADRLLVGTVLGATSLAFYSVATQLTSQIHAVAAAAFSIIAPAVSRNLGSNRPEHLLRAAIRKAITLNVVVCAVMSIGLLLAGSTIFKVWIGAAAANEATKLLPELVFVYFALAVSIVPYYVLNGLGKMKDVAIIGLVGGCLALAVGAKVIHTDGLDGLALSRGAYSIVLLTLFIPMVRSLRSSKN